MDRIEFLSQWLAFPAAPPGCQSLTRWKNQPGWVGGQIEFASGKACLTSSQSDPLPLCFSESPSSVLQTGDHVAVELSQQNSDGQWEVLRWLLLAPGESRGTATMAHEWPKFLYHVRDFFRTRGFLELETPSLVECPGLEPTLEPFSVVMNMGSSSVVRYLPTSPEIHLKKAICLGFSDIFEIKTCYRNGENSELHQPEFHMLEWYRAFANLDLIIEDLQALVSGFGGPSIEVTTFQRLFRQHLNVDLTPTTSRPDLWRWCEQEKLHPQENDSSTDLFHRLWIDRIERHLKTPTIVRDFPPEQAALARIKPDGWADRFEFFWNGIEIANAFHEVNDPTEQSRRWELESLERKRLNRTLLKGDDDLLRLMKVGGLPPTGGIALGLERLFMAIHQVRDIRSLRLFPYR